MVAAVGALTGSLSGCGSTGPTPEPVAESSVRSAPAEDAFTSWERTTRERADDLLAESRWLADEGDPLGALNRIDEALCLVLEPPPGYATAPAYLDFVASLLAEAEELEHGLIVDEGLDPESQELVALPPIELPELDEAAVVPRDPAALPVSEYPLVRNATVEQFLDALTRDGEYRRRIETGLARSGDYLPMIRDRLVAAGLPQELAYLPLIESAFSVKAYSRARAHGMWQFIASTGRHYGLEIGSLVDERRDPVRSTEAAVAYLADLHAEFGDWHLALAGYNSGAGNVRRAIRRSGSHDFWTLKRYLPRETRNYVPAFIASVLIAKDPVRWGFPTPQERPWDFDRVAVPDALDLQFLAERIALPVDELRSLNPAIRRDLTPANRTTDLWLPTGWAATVEAVLAEVPRSEWAPRTIHTVRRGESLSTIAQRYDSTVSAIRQANGLRGSLIHPGQSLIVPRFGAGVDEAPRRVAEHGGYVVQSNDTLWDIARSFNVSLDDLCAANGLSRSDVIRPGQRLRLPDGSQPRPGAHGAGSEVPVWSGTYTVRRGDTLSGIAARHGVSVSALRQANGLSGSRIHPGDALTVPAAAPRSASAQPTAEGTTYKVRRGDTLYDIARAFGVSVSELRRANGLNGSKIYPGDVLRIPASQAKG